MKKYILYIVITIFFTAAGYFTWYLSQKKHSTNSISTYTKIEIDTIKQNFGVLSIKDTSNHNFIIRNTGNEPLLIKFIQTDCGCTIAHWDTNPILPGNETNVKIQVTPIESGYF